MCRITPIWIIVMVGIMLLTTPATTLAYPAVHVPPWYLSELPLDPTNLPAGVQIEGLLDDTNVTFVISNTTARSLYIYDQMLPTATPFPSPDLQVQALSGSTVEYEVARNALDPPEILLGTERFYRERPPNVVPPSHHATLYLSHDNQRLTVPLTITYRLNPDYQPEDLELAQNTRCRPSGGNLLTYGTYGLATLAILGTVVLIVRQRRR